VLDKLAQLKSDEVSRNFLVDDLKKNTTSIKTKYEKIESDLEIGETLIRNHCDNARNNAQLAIEEAHLKLDQMHNIFMEEIDIYEKECQTQFKQNQTNKSETQKIVEESRHFYEKSEQLLKQFKIDKLALTNMLSDADSVLNKLESTEDKLFSEMFKGINLKFYINQDAIEKVGSIKRQNIDLHYLKNIENVKELSFNNKFDDINLDRKFGNIFLFKPFKNQSFTFSYLNKSNYINFAILDKETNIRKKRKNVIYNIPINCFHLKMSRNFIFVYTIEKSLDTDTLFTVLFRD